VNGVWLMRHGTHPHDCPTARPGGSTQFSELAGRSAFQRDDGWFAHQALRRFPVGGYGQPDGHDDRFDPPEGAGHEQAGAGAIRRFG